jgi:hypothetical protein
MKPVFLNIFFIILLAMPQESIVAQTDALENDGTEQDSSLLSGKVSKHLLYTAEGIGSTPLFPGSSVNQNQAFSYASILYGFNNELFVSTSAFKLLSSDYPADFCSYSINYTYSLTRWFDLSFTASQIRFINNIKDSLFSSFVYADINTGFSYKFWHTYISSSGLFSGSSQYFFQFKNSVYLQTTPFLRGKVFLSFNPYINMLFGSYFKSKTTIVTTPIITYDTISVSVSGGTGTDLTGDRIYAGSAGTSTGPTTMMNSSTTLVTSSETTYSKVSGLMEISMGLPVAINFRRLTFEAEAGYVIPEYSNALMPVSKGFVFMFSAYIKVF